jgi:8-amino-3,8-dideoxy-alpha-D-manno-octulosonate transaminase
VKPNDEVITQAFTFVATVEAITEVGAIPVIAEINGTLNMDPVDLEKKITKKTKLIIPVHMLGAPCQMDEIMKIARHYRLRVMEDAAQALGAEYKGRKLGTIADTGAFSFDFGKALTTGEGGMILTNNAKIYKTARALHDHGHDYNPSLPRGEDTRSISGFNYRLTELQGAVGLAQLKKLDYILGQQRKNKKKIKDSISDLNLQFRNIVDDGETGDTLVFFLEDSKAAKYFENRLRENGLGTKNLPDALSWHFTGMWKHIFYQYKKFKGKNLVKIWQESYSILSRAIAIPIFVNMDKARIERIVDAIRTITKDL